VPPGGKVGFSEVAADRLSDDLAALDLGRLAVDDGGNHAAGRRDAIDSS